MAGTVPKRTAPKFLGPTKFIPENQEGLESDSVVLLFFFFSVSMFSPVLPPRGRGRMPPSALRPSLRCPGEVGPAPPWSLMASPQLPPPPGWAVSAPGAGGGSRADARPVLQGAASPFGWAGIQRTPDPGETPLKSSAVRRRTRPGPVLLEAPSCPAWDSEDCLGHCWGRSPSAPS